MGDVGGEVGAHGSGVTAIYGTLGGSGEKVVTTAGTQVLLMTANTETKSIMIKALIGNTGNIFVGISTVASTDGWILKPGEIMSMDINHADAEVWIDSAVNGEGVRYIYTK